ncbi:MAG: tyrosine-type recombinase/integrase, partial [Clostridiales bacterium]|nr:tyrosine-type recombinase/integrase [Clostridiales bacterium]
NNYIGGTSIMMKDRLINEILTTMSISLNKEQISQLAVTLSETFKNIDIVENETNKNDVLVLSQENYVLLKRFFVNKKLDGLSQSSINAYNFCIKKFLNFIDYRNLCKVDTNLIRLFLYNCKNTCSKTTVDNYRRYLNSFYQWLDNEGYVDKNPCKKIARIKEPERHKRYFSELEIEKLRDSCKTKKEMALIDLLISSGVRIGEIPTIKISKINWENGCFSVIGKGDKERYCYMNVRAKKHIQEYLEERMDNGIISDYLFCHSRKPYDLPLSKSSINKTIKNIGKRCGVEDIHVHGIRTYFATNLSDKGVRPETIQLLMGHGSYSTTVRYYCKPNNNNAQYVVSKFC